MAKEVISESQVSDFLQLVPGLMKLPSKKLWIDYDQEADVLYVNFQHPQGATDSEMLKNGILVRRRGKQVVGLTILEASHR